MVGNLEKGYSVSAVFFVDLCKKTSAHVSSIDFVFDLCLDEDEQIDEVKANKEEDEKQEADEDNEKWVYTWHTEACFVAMAHWWW